MIKPTGSVAGTATRTVPTRCPHALRWCLRARRNATTGVSSVVMVSSSCHGEFNAQNTAHGAEHAGQWQVRGPCRVWSPHLWISSWRPGLGGFLATRTGTDLGGLSHAPARGPAAPSTSHALLIALR